MPRRTIIKHRAVFASRFGEWRTFEAGAEAELASVFQLPDSPRCREMIASYKHARGTKTLFNKDKRPADVVLVFFEGDDEFGRAPRMVSRDDLVFDDAREPARRAEFEQPMPDGTTKRVVEFEGVSPSRGYCDDLAKLLPSPTYPSRDEAGGDPRPEPPPRGASLRPVSQRREAAPSIHPRVRRGGETTTPSNVARFDRSRVGRKPRIRPRKPDDDGDR